MINKIIIQKSEGKIRPLFLFKIGLSEIFQLPYFWKEDSNFKPFPKISKINKKENFLIQYKVI